MDRRILPAAALAAALLAAPAGAEEEDTLTGTLVYVEDGGRSFTILSPEGKNHTFEAPPSIDLEAVEPGSTLQVKAEPITDVERGETRRASAVALLPPDAETDEGEGAREEGGPALPSDPASGGAPGGGPPSGGIPSGGVPSGGAPSGGIPSGGGIAP